MHFTDKDKLRRHVITRVGIDYWIQNNNKYMTYIEAIYLCDVVSSLKAITINRKDAYYIITRHG